MDHLPVPQQPVQGRFAIPFMSIVPFDGSDFLSYPDRHRWDFQGPRGNVVIRQAGIEPSLLDVGAFLQTWLLYGLPSQFLGRTLDDLDLFKDHDEFGSPIISTRPLGDIMSEWSRNMGREYWALDTNKLIAWKNRMQKCIMLARDTLLQVRSTSKYDGLGPLCLSLASVGEYLNQVLKDIFFDRDLQQPSRISWRIHEKADCGDVLFVAMFKSGWCPHRLAKLDSSEMFSVGKLWYLANLRPPWAETDHGSCSESACKLDWVDEGRYVVKHESGECRCSLQGPEQGQVLSILDQGAIPLISVAKEHDPEGLSLLARPRGEGSQFVAISHIWSDGHGNPDENALPQCFLEKLSTLVKSLPNSPESFWIDTLCVPISPPAARKKAIVRLRESYELATCVLVIDEYLCTLEANQMHVLEIVTRIDFSKWSERLWTFQEGRINTNVLFQFKDGPVNLERATEDFRRSFNHIPSLPSHSVDTEVLAHYTASHLFPEQKDLADDYDLLPMVRYAVCSRSTSKASDEPICLASIMKLDIARILQVSVAEDRMEIFWSLVPKLPIGLAFSTASRKLTQSGYRWAPASLMGDLNAKQWNGPHDSDSIFEASASDAGLVVKLPTFMISPVRGEAESAPDRCKKSKEDFFYHVARVKPGVNLSFCDENMTHYGCAIEETWHQDTHHPRESEAVAIVLSRIPVSLRSENLPHYSIDPEWIERGLMVTFDPSSSDHPGQTEPIVAKGFRHVTLVKTGELYQELNPSIRHCAQTTLKEPAGNNSQHQEIHNSGRVEQIVRAYLKEHPRTLDLARQICVFEGYAQDQDEAVILDFVRSVRDVIRRWPLVKIDAEPKLMTWCID